MKVLGLDSATWTASVGVVEGDRTIAERSTPATTSHAVSLLGLIDATLTDAALTVGALDLIAVSAGPGSFTGLRIGLSVAKGLALATGVPVVRVSTLEALAYAAGERPGIVCAALDARKGEVYMAAFRRHGATMETIIAPAVVAVDELALRLPAPCTLVGDAVDAYPDRLGPRLDTRVAVIPFALTGPRGAVVASLGRRQFEVGGAERIDTLEPTYIRPSEAELKAAPARSTPPNGSVPASHPADAVPTETKLTG